MKKRLLALTVVLAFCMALLVPAAVMTGGDSGSGIGITTASFSSLDITPEITNALKVDVATASFTHIATVETSKFTKDTDKISWKAIAPKEKAANGNIDLTKIVTGVKASKPVYLILAKLGTDTLTYKTYASVTSLSVAAYQIVPASAKISDKPVAKYASDTSIFTIDKLTTAMEYTLANDVNNWTKVTDASMNFEMKPFAQEYWVRTAGTATAGPGPHIAVKVAAQAAAPVLKLDYAKGVVSGFKNMEVYLDREWVSLDATVKTATVSASPTSYDATDKKLNIHLGGELIYRVKTSTDGKKPGSVEGYIYVSPETVADIGNVDISEEMFTLTGPSLKVNGALPVQVRDANGKWKTVKEIKPKTAASATANAVYEDSYTIRLAGTKSIWPSEVYTLKISATGEVTLDSAS